MRLLLLVLSCVVGQSSNLFAHDFEWKNLLMASLKLRQGLDYDANVDSYMEVFRPDVWNRYRNDEFEMVGKRKETIAMMKQSIDSFDLEEYFDIRTSTRFRNYDFDSKCFPIDALTEKSYFYASSYPNGGFPSTIEVFMRNPKVVNKFDMGESQAKEFLRTRKDRNGDINRNVYLKLSVRIVKAKPGPNELIAEIMNYRIYADENYTKLLHEFDLAKDTAAKTAVPQLNETAEKAST
ncbi:MAG: DUF4852 domain-containing protein [Pirellulaceae bacterium]|nr:DUF4852 domain-containing protein [Pirellulaceae bacterium]